MKNKVLCIAIALLGFASVCAVHLESVEQDSPENIVSRFFELDSKGTRLTPEGWYAVAALFVRPEAPPKRLLVEVSIGSVYVGHPEIKGEQAVVGAEFMLLGQIDSALRFSWGEKPPGPDKTRQFISLQLTEHHWELRYKEAAPREVRDVRKWRIKDFERKPLITLDTAIRYVTESRDKSADPVIQRNADRTLATLGKYRSK